MLKKLLFLGIVLSFCASKLLAINIENEAKVDSLFDKAQSLMMNNNYEKALNVFEEIAKIKINDDTTFTYIGLCALETDRYNQAIEAYNKAIKINPHILGAYFGLGKTYALINKPVLAAESFDMALSLDPSNSVTTPIFFFSQSIGAHEIVIKAGEKLIDGYEESLFSMPYYEGICFSYIALGKYKDAADIGKRVIKVFPDNKIGYYLLGRVYALSALHSEAINYYKKAITIDPEYEDAFLHMGVCYTYEGDYNRAKEAYIHTIKINPDNASAHSMLGSVYAELEQYDKAIMSHEQVLRINPDDLTNLVSLGNLHGMNGSPLKAREIFEEVIDVDPNNAGAHYLLGITLLGLKNASGALSEYNILKTIDPNLASKLYDLIY